MTNATHNNNQTAIAPIYDWGAIFAAAEKTRDTIKRQFYIDRAGERDGNALFNIFACAAWSARGGDFWAWARAKFGKGFCVSRADFVAGLEIFIEGEPLLLERCIDYETRNLYHRGTIVRVAGNKFESIIECAKSDLGAAFCELFARNNFFIFDAAADSVWDYRAENSNGDFTHEKPILCGGNGFCVYCGVFYFNTFHADGTFLKHGGSRCFDCKFDLEDDEIQRFFRHGVRGKGNTPVCQICRTETIPSSMATEKECVNCFFNRPVDKGMV